MTRRHGSRGRAVGRYAAAAALLSAAGAVTGCEPTVTGSDFAVLEKSLVGKGYFRKDRDPADAPFTNAMLVEDFDRIAFGLEAAINGGRARLDHLERWEEPIRWSVLIDGREEAEAIRDVERTFDRLARATGLEISRAPSPTSSNVDILFLGQNDYGRAEAWARSMLGENAMRAIGDFRTDANFLCYAKTFSRSEAEDGLPAGSVSYAMVLIRKGYSDANRLSCVEEELAQMLGLSNDDPRVRPSVFNDDEEFALLTAHDELLLRILYDPRLRAGMSYEMAMPIVARVVEELRPGL